MAELVDRRVLVTGASSGIGAATARACADGGARVALVARRADRLSRLAEELGGVARAADLSDEDEAADAVAGAVDGLGGLDAVVHAAGLMRLGGVTDGRSADWRALLEVNVLALLVVTQAALPALRAAGGGDVVTIGSQSGRRVPSAAAGPYAASKFAAHALSEGLRRELLAEGVRVTVVAPGLVRTELFDSVEHPGGARLRERSATEGVDAADVAAQVVHALAQPRDVLLREIVISGRAQES